MVSGQQTNPNLCMWWIQEGQARVRFPDQQEATAGQREWLILPPGDRCQEFTPGTSLYSLCLKAVWPDGRVLVRQGLPLTLIADESRELEQPLKRLHTLVQQEFPSGPGPLHRPVSNLQIPAQVYFELNAVLSDFLRVLLDALEKKGVMPDLHQIQDARVVRALDVLENTPFHELPDFSDIASRVGLSPEQLTRQFKHWVGHTPKAHLHHRKLETAKALLASKETPLKEVAYQLGFSSPSAFSNWCTHHLGGSPRKLRKHSDGMWIGP